MTAKTNGTPAWGALSANVAAANAAEEPVKDESANAGEGCVITGSKAFSKRPRRLPVTAFAWPFYQS